MSTASLIVGVAAASTGTTDVLVAGIAGLVAGAMSMAAGEYVSVSSQADAETADLELERAEQTSQPAFELDKLSQIYIARGVTPDLARQVAKQMMEKDPLGAHLRDELGISEFTTARPVQAALTSAMIGTAAGSFDASYPDFADRKHGWRRAISVMRANVMRWSRPADMAIRSHRLRSGSGANRNCLPA